MRGRRRRDLSCTRRLWGKRRVLFPKMVDDSGVMNDIDGLEEAAGLATRVDSAADEARTTEREEDVDIDQKLVERAAHAAS